MLSMAGLDFGARAQTTPAAEIWTRKKAEKRFRKREWARGLKAAEPHYAAGEYISVHPPLYPYRYNRTWPKLRNFAARTNFSPFSGSHLVISGFTTLCETDDSEEIALFGQQREALLRRYSPLPAGPPAVDTYRRVFAKRDVTRFNACFMAWMQQVLPAEAAGQRCGDGKTRRGSGAKPLHVVSAVASGSGLSLGQVAGPGKGPEPRAGPTDLARPAQGVGQL